MKVNSILKLSFVRYLYQYSYYIYLIKVGLGLGEDTKVSFAIFNLSLLGCQSLWETLLRNDKKISGFGKKRVEMFFKLRNEGLERILRDFVQSISRIWAS